MQYLTFPFLVRSWYANITLTLFSCSFSFLPFLSFHLLMEKFYLPTSYYISFNLLFAIWASYINKIMIFKLVVWFISLNMMGSRCAHFPINDSDHLPLVQNGTRFYKNITFSFSIHCLWTYMIKCNAVNMGTYVNKHNHCGNQYGALQITKTINSI